MIGLLWIPVQIRERTDRGAISYLSSRRHSAAPSGLPKFL
jgi:hypothetical protein